MWAFDLHLVLLAILLDLVLGDPRRMPHLTRWAGACSVFWERKFRALNLDGIGGGLLFFLAVQASVLVPAWGVHLALAACADWLAAAWDVFVIYQSIAFRDLLWHVQAVIKPLRRHDLPQARQRVGWIVGRDTDHLDAGGVCRAAIEALAESCNDGVFAPLFWAVLLGPFGALGYRVTNTLDSMVGHRDARYERFGKVSARVDDLLGWVPARLTALLLWLGKRQGAWSAIATDARSHASPNAGWPEATVAHVLHIRLGGVNYYEGERHKGHIFNASGRPPALDDLEAAIRLSWAGLGMFSGAVLILALI
ncbi:MAG: adenosylcobinamide-phosphate synthase [Puniceicoccaceae bacterium 5H]|nr:MAG: adenosylcobinamide-phosphate synthase [Puniceicoccaceae bacterium 5H]